MENAGFEVILEYNAIVTLTLIELMKRGGLEVVRREWGFCRASDQQGDEETLDCMEQRAIGTVTHKLSFLYLNDFRLVMMQLK